jgi:hypothetical protein
MIRVPCEDVVFDKLLRAAVEFEFDVMGLHGIDLEWFLEIFAQEFSGLECGVDRRGEKLGHVRVVLADAARAADKKIGRGSKSPPVQLR